MYKHGDYLAICDRCSFEFHAAELRKEWTGFMVCANCYETRHPQDLLKGRKERIGVPWTRPEPTDKFITVSYVASTVGVQDSTVPSGNNNGTL